MARGVSRRGFVSTLDDLRALPEVEAVNLNVIFTLSTPLLSTQESHYSPLPQHSLQPYELNRRIDALDTDAAFANNVLSSFALLARSKIVHQ